MSDENNNSTRAKVSYLTRPRRAIHELSEYTLCPLVGLNLSDTHLRIAMADCGETELSIGMQRHGWAIAASKQADHPFSVWLSEYLDQQHADLIIRFEPLRKTDALRDYWFSCHRGGETAGAWWALITHPHSSDNLLTEIAGELHLLGHTTARERIASKHTQDNAQRAVHSLGKRVLQLQREAQAATERHSQEQHLLLQRLIAAQRQVMHLCEENPQPSQNALSEQIALARAEIEELRRERTVLEQQLIIEQERQQTKALQAPSSSRCVLYVGDGDQSTCPLQDWIAQRKGALLRCGPSDRDIAQHIARADVVVYDSDSSSLHKQTIDLCNTGGKPVLLLNQPFSERHAALLDRLSAI